MTTHNFPTEGQFVVVWKFNDKIWSSTYAYFGGDLYEYSGGAIDEAERWFPGILPTYPGQEILAIFTEDQSNDQP